MTEQAASLVHDGWDEDEGWKDCGGRWSLYVEGIAGHPFTCVRVFYWAGDNSLEFCPWEDGNAKIDPSTGAEYPLSTALEEAILAILPPYPDGYPQPEEEATE